MEVFSQEVADDGQQNIRSLQLIKFITAFPGLFLYVFWMKCITLKFLD